MFEKYRVKSNETIDDIARMFHTNKEYIEDLNNLYYSESLREGMDIIVPKNKTKYFDTYTINKGDTLYGISKKYNINPNLLASINGLNLDDYIYQNQVILLPVSGYSYYVTAEGDTLETVSQMFKKNKENILKENETIYLLPGQILVSERK
ncbi:MAG: LysM peptidoglycan-binding domain-containing protein [bacterium]|nr:LysM peptidoglycan-binding domain-containing protein [bacterium]